MSEYANEQLCYCGQPASFTVTFYPEGSQYREVRVYCEAHTIATTRFDNKPWKIVPMGRYIKWLSVREDERRKEAEEQLASSQLALDV